MKLKKMAAALAAMTVMGAIGTLSAEAAIPEGSSFDYPPVAAVEAVLKKEKGTIYPIGKPNVGYEKYFTGLTFISPLTPGANINVANVTFTKGAHTYWHIHRGSCQILVTGSGRGYYQLWGEPVQSLTPGIVATIPEGTKHWHGAGPNSMMQHLSVMAAEGATTEWLEPVDDEVFKKLKQGQLSLKIFAKTGFLSVRACLENHFSPAV